SLGDQEDASKQGRKIDDIDQDAEITLVDETQGRLNEEEMFRVNNLDGDKVIMDATAGMDTELVKDSETKAEGSSKRAGGELESKKSKKQKLDEKVEAKVDSDQEKSKMKIYMKIVSDDEVAIDAIPLATKPPIIVDCKIINE
nr:hypothetical protein [Tanacetum cinerariifolium]